MDVDLHCGVSSPALLLVGGVAPLDDADDGRGLQVERGSTLVPAALSPDPGCVQAEVSGARADVASFIIPSSWGGHTTRPV